MAVALGHRVRRADRDREPVDAGRRDERAASLRVGAHAGRVSAVLAADLAELRLDPEAGDVRATGSRRPSSRRSAAYVEVRGVDHERADAVLRRRRDALGEQAGVLQVVEVQADRDGRRVRELAAGGEQRPGATPWNRTAFSLTCSRTRRAGALERRRRSPRRARGVITLKAGTAVRACAPHPSTRSRVRARVTAAPARPGRRARSGSASRSPWAADQLVAQLPDLRPG